MFLFDDLHDVGHGVAEADLVRMMAVMIVMRLVVVPPYRRRGTTLSPAHANGNGQTDYGNTIFLLQRQQHNILDLNTKNDENQRKIRIFLPITTTHKVTLYIYMRRIVFSEGTATTDFFRSKTR